MTTKYVYVGPDRPFGLPLTRNTVLAGEPESVLPALKPFFADHPQFRRLFFVPVAELAQARQALATPGTPQALFSEQLKKAVAARKSK